jgi:hypothetical protein
MHSEHGPVGDRRILVNALRAARAEIATLTEQRDRAMKALRFICVIDASDASLFERVEHGRVTLAALDAEAATQGTET